MGGSHKTKAHLSTYPPATKWIAASFWDISHATLSFSVTTAAHQSHRVRSLPFCVLLTKSHGHVREMRTDAVTTSSGGGRVAGGGLVVAAVRAGGT